MSAAAPAVVIAAPASGSGKTTVATGLMGALRRAGHTVAPFKVGPDFIDPGYHTLAAGRPGRNLDPVLVGDAEIGPLYRHGSDGADLSLVEGVMGLFDGRIADQVALPPYGSTAHVASLLGAPVVLVIDARGQSHSVAALLHGFRSFDPGVRIGGVILNRVGSPRHEQVLRQACEQVGLPVFGSIPRTEALDVPSRHLGLVTAEEYGTRAHEVVEAMTTLVGRHVDLAALSAIAACGVGDPPWRPDSGEPAGAGVTIATATGPAFTFRYHEHAEMLRAAGADVAEFDPLTDPLPDGAAGLILPGGFPELFAADLSANDGLRQQIRALAASGAPILAECGGLTYLVDDLDGHRMCGVLSGSAAFTRRLTLGYRTACAVAPSALYDVGELVTGHEFHRTAVTLTGDQPPAWRFTGTSDGPTGDGAVTSGLHASYLHTHPAGVRRAVARFVAAAARSKLAG